MTHDNGANVNPRYVKPGNPAIARAVVQGQLDYASQKYGRERVIEWVTEWVNETPDEEAQ